MYNQNKFFRHYREVDDTKWQFTYFKPIELASKGDETLLLDVDAVSKLDKLRWLLNKPINLNSAYRDPLHNFNVGGSPNSQHLLGTAFDIRLDNHDKYELVKYAKQVGFTGFGYYKTFLHVDTGRERWWGEKW